MFTQAFAIQNEFTLITVEDGNYWVRYTDVNSFYQIKEDGSSIQYYDGNVFDLSFDELSKELNGL